MKSTGSIIKTTVVVAMMLAGTIVYGQPSGGGGQGLGGTPPATGAPIDSGTGILLAGIAAYAHRKLKSVLIVNQDSNN